MEELAEKNFDKECLNDFSVPHYNEVRLVHYIHDKIIVHHYLHKVESLILCTNYIWSFCAQGCLLKLQEVMQSYITIVGAIIVSIWAVVVGGIIFALNQL